MITIKMLSYVTAVLGVTGILFGFGTGWFAAGLITGTLSLILHGLYGYVEARARIDMDLAQLDSEPIEYWPVFNGEIIDHRATWPAEVGAPE